MKRQKKKPMDDERYEVTVWDMIDGDIVKKRWDATYDEAEEIREEYADDPRFSVQIEEK